MTLVIGAVENCDCFSIQNSENNKLGGKSLDTGNLKVWSGKSTNQSLDAGPNVHLIHSFIHCDSVSAHQQLQAPHQALGLQSNTGHGQCLEGKS